MTWNPGETCSRCGKPARLRIAVTSLTGDALWLWYSCVDCEPRPQVPLDAIERVQREEESAERDSAGTRSGQAS